MRSVCSDGNVLMEWTFTGDSRNSEFRFKISSDDDTFIFDSIDDDDYLQATTVESDDRITYDLCFPENKDYTFYVNDQRQNGNAEVMLYVDGEEIFDGSNLRR